MPIYRNPESVTDPFLALLLTAVPENDLGNKTITRLAELVGVTTWSINKWVRKGSLSPKRAKQIVEISRIQSFTKGGKPILGDPRVTQDQLSPFVYNV